MKRILVTLAGLLLLFLFWLFRPDNLRSEVTLPVELPELGISAAEADHMVRSSERRSGPLKPDNHARIIWNPEYRDRKAPCSIVYIHGFTSSYGEGSPVHERVARNMGCHLYISRLHGHGLQTDEPLKHMQADSLLIDAAQAVALGNLLGEQVILMGNSMGGMLSLHLAAAHPEAVDVLVLFSPLIEFATFASRFFDRTWAQRLMRLWLGEPYLRVEPDSDDHARYWYNRIRLEALATLKTMKQQLLDDEVYRRITQPVFAGYYLKDEDNRDEVVSVSAIMDIEDKLSTPEGQTMFKAFPRADAHVISSSYRSDEHILVSNAVIRFLGYHVE